MANNGSSILSLTSINKLPRRHIDLDGVSYEIRSMRELSLTEQHRVLEEYRGVLEKLKSEDLGNQVASVVETLDRSVRLIVVDQSFPLELISDGDKIEIIRVFFHRESAAIPPARNELMDRPSAGNA